MLPSWGVVGSRRGDQVGRGVAGDGGHDDHLAAVAVDDVGLGQVVDRVVAALDPDVGPQPLQQLLPASARRRWRRRRHRPGPPAPGRGRPRTRRAAFTLQCPHRVVGVDQHDQRIAELARLPEQPDVARCAAGRSSRRWPPPVRPSACSLRSQSDHVGDGRHRRKTLPANRSRTPAPGVETAAAPPAATNRAAASTAATTAAREIGTVTERNRRGDGEPIARPTDVGPDRSGGGEARARRRGTGRIARNTRAPCAPRVTHTASARHCSRSASPTRCLRRSAAPPSHWASRAHTRNRGATPRMRIPHHRHPLRGRRQQRPAAQAAPSARAVVGDADCPRLRQRFDDVGRQRLASCIASPWSMRSTDCPRARTRVLVRWHRSWAERRRERRCREQIPQTATAVVVGNAGRSVRRPPRAGPPAARQDQRHPAGARRARCRRPAPAPRG